MAEHKCPICGEKLDTLQLLERHEQEHHDVEGDEARTLAEQRQREPEGDVAAGPGGNAVIDTTTGEIESR